ncbi:MAG: transglycosylase family protein [Frankiaceae bacterium]
MSSLVTRPRLGRRSRLLKRTGGVTAAAVAAAGAAGVLAAPPAAAASDPWAQVRQCESGGNYSINTGSGFYGAYQMTADAWRSVGFSGLPSNASPAMQDEAARRLYAHYGTTPWPECGKRYGGASSPARATSSAWVTSSGGYAVGTVTSHWTPTRQVPSYTSRQATASRHQAPSPHRYAPSGTHAPALDIRLVSQTRQDVRLYQISLQRLGYRLAADGRFGPVTALTTMRFQAAHALLVDGRVGPQTRAAIPRAL